MKTAIIAGASGLVGSSLLQLLLNHKVFEKVIVISRRNLHIEHQKLKTLIINFDNLEDYKDQIQGDVLYFCLGTTRSKTPDLQEYKKIEHEYSLKLAQICRGNGIPQFHYISALGANPSSSIFYSKLKGETEEDLKKINVKSLHIYQPSLLTGERKELRIIEKLSIGLMSILNPLLQGNLKKYQSIKANTVAKAMLNQTIKEVEGIHIYPSDKIKQLS